MPEWRANSAPRKALPLGTGVVEAEVLQVQARIMGAVEETEEALPPILLPTRPGDRGAPSEASPESQERQEHLPEAEAAVAAMPHLTAQA
jgi:hypothetical protein